VHARDELVAAFNDLAIHMKQHSLARAHANLAHLPSGHAEPPVKISGKQGRHAPRVSEKRAALDHDEIEQAVVQEGERRDTGAVAVLP